MKLLTKTSLNFLSVTLFIFLFGILAFYFLLRGQVDQNLNLELEKRKNSIENRLNVDDPNRIPPNPDERIVITPLDENANIPELDYADTLIYDESQDRYVPFRKLGFVTSHNNQKFYVQIFKSLEESDLLIIRIFLILTLLVIVLIVSLLLMNRITLKQSWKIFYDSIRKINRYDVDTHEEFNLQESDITEFNDLNKVLKSMTNRIKSDYLNLKEYTENASHEIQNPLAIINSKLELLLQSGNMEESQYRALVQAYEASNRLSRLNKTLILLTKIENRQFPDSEKVSIQTLVENQMERLEDIIESKNIRIQNEVKSDFTVEMNPYLAEILFVNLIKNAVRHNTEDGVIMVQQENRTIKISNSGEDTQMKSEDLFKRFYKASKSSESLGLGLAIVKNICEVYHFNISYKYDGMHVFSISFTK